jgi:hypothetical protein
MAKTKTQGHGAIAEIRRILIRRAKMGKTITYSDLAGRIRDGRIIPQSPMLSGWLSLLSEAEYKAGRGLLSAVVVRKKPPRRGIPGIGFFRLVPVSRCKPENQAKCWRRAVGKVFAYWQRHPRHGG